VSQPLYCPECRSEYLASASLCAECGVPLVSEAGLDEASAEGLPPVSELVCVRASSLGWAQRLSERLAAEGIYHRIQVAAEDGDDGGERRPGANLPFGVYVRATDLERAAGIDADFVRSQIPDLPEPEAAAADAEGCPACGAALEADDAECPDCGLALGPLE
jgi:hypothetical protein